MHVGKAIAFDSWFTVLKHMRELGCPHGCTEPCPYYRKLDQMCGDIGAHLATLILNESSEEKP